MNVVFWSPLAGRCAVSSNCFAAATYMSLNTDYTCCAVPLNCSNRGAENAFLSAGGRKVLQRSVGSFGVDALKVSIMGGFDSVSEVKDAAMQIHPSLDVFASSSDPRKETVRKDLSSGYERLIDSLENCYDIAFIDVGSGYSGMTEKSLEKADVIVVCLRQDLDVLDTLEELCDLGGAPCLYVVSDYEKDNLLSMKNIRKKCSNVKPGNSLLIPHCTAFANAVNSTTLLKWFVTMNGDGKPKSRLIPSGRNGKDGFAVQEFFLSHGQLEKSILKMSGR